MNNKQFDPYFYTVWALGYDDAGNCTDGEMFLGEFDNYEDALACFHDNYGIELKYSSKVHLVIEQNMNTSDGVETNDIMKEVWC